jgi:hypothetical protein
MPDWPPLRDYSGSRAVVMGTWDYTYLRPVPAAGHSLERMVDLLTGPLCGWPRDKLFAFSNERSPGDLADQLITAFEDVTEIALFYYVGHGQIDSDDQLCLGLVNSRTEANRRAATSLPFQAVRRALLESRAATKIVILDCCFAGLASQPDNTLTMIADNVLDMTAGAGAYTMAASGAYNTAWYETGPSIARPQTYFTRYLADLVETGIPGLPAVLPLHALFAQLSFNLARDKRPTPVERNVDAAREFAFAYNAAAPPELSRDPDLERQRLAASLTRRSPRPRWQVPVRWRRRQRPTLSSLSIDRTDISDIEPFVPNRVDEASALRAVETIAVGAHPTGTTGGMIGQIDTLVGVLEDQWIADIRAQHARYVARVTPMLELAEASAAEADVNAIRDRSILSHKVLALESALLRLVGLNDVDADRVTSTRSDTEDEHPPNARQADREAGDSKPSHELADLDDLLGARDSRRYARWEDGGHSDPALLAGKTIATYVHILALCAAAAADIGAFFQIVELVLPDYSQVLVFLVVGGFTATVLYTAHACGLLFRDRKAGASWINRSLPYFCAMIWLGLGVAALEVRLHALGTSAPSLSIGSTQPTSAPGFRYGPAILFFALYIATGLVAGIGAYLTHNPLRGSYAAALRAYDRAAKRLASSTFQARVSQGRCKIYHAELTAASNVVQHEVKIRLVLAARLKGFATSQIARPSNAAVTGLASNED